MKTVNEIGISDIICGATFLGSGGGGSPKNGLELLKSISASVRADGARMADPQEVPDYSMICVIAGMGAPEALLRRGWEDEDVPALRMFEQAVGRKMDYVIAIETGGFNSIVPIHAAVANGIPIVDGDGVGRAVPQLEMTMYSVHKLPIAPVAVADPRGNSAVCYPIDPPMAERMARALTVEFGMKAGLACHPMAGWQMKRAVIPGTYAKSQRVGRAIREAGKKGADPINAVVAVSGGWELARGSVKDKKVETRGGFDYGSVFLDGLRVDYKNENIIAWDGNKPKVISPDLICWLSVDGRPLTNADIRTGMEVAVIGIKAHKSWRTPEGLAAYRPVLEELKYTKEYRPIEELLRTGN